MKCKKCGCEMSDEALFCPECGTKVETVETTTTPSKSENPYDISSIWPEWQVEKQLGKGAFGTVYQVSRHDHNLTSYAAVKVISIPQDSSEIDTLRSEGLDINASKTYLKGVVDDVVREIQLMESFKGVQNIVSVEDYRVVERTDELGWYIYIRMELLTPFNTYICDKKMSEEEIIKLGCDICTALELCEQKKIIHRDIKPENIFVNDFGFFKLGDFGVARTMANMTGGMSQKGTPFYMAPEVFVSNKYDSRVDIYSLGIVMYKLLNANRFPFLNTEKQLLDPNERANSVERRRNGEPLPEPCEASPSMANLILRACAFDPNNRFANATEMKEALMNVKNGTYIPVDITLDKTTSVRHSDSLDGTTSVRGATGSSDNVSNASKEKKTIKIAGFSKPKIILASILAGIVLIAIIAAYIGISWYTSPEQKLYRALDSANCEEAYDIYKYDYEGEDTEKVIASVEECLEKIKSDYASGNIVYDTAKDKISTISKMNVSSTHQAIQEATAYINKINNSKKAFDTAEKYYKDGKYKDAIVKYGEVVEEDSNYKNAQTKLTESTNKYRSSEILAAEKYATDGDYDKAINILETALKVIPEDAEITKKLSAYKGDRTTEQKSTALTTAKTKADAGDYTGAYNTINNVIKQNGEDDELTAALENYQDLVINEAITKASIQSESADYLGALRTINQAIKTVGEDETLATAAKTYEDAYAKSISAQVDAHLAENDVEAAKEVLSSVAGEVADNEVINDKEKELSQYKTVSLSELSPLNGGFTWNTDSPVDPFGTDYSKVFNYTTIHSYHSFSDARTFSAEYKVDEKYDIMSMVIAPSNCTNENGYGYVQIYVNNILRYTSPKITRKFEPQKFDIDISDAKYIKVVVNVREKGCVLITDASLSTNPAFVKRETTNETPLNTLDVFSGGYTWDSEYPQDAFSTDYSKVCNYTLLEGYHSFRDVRVFSSEYYVNNKYNSFNVNVSPMECFGGDRSTTIKIYIDNALSYTSQSISKKTSPFNINLDIKGAKYLKIVVEGNGCVILSEAKLLS